MKRTVKPQKKKGYQYAGENAYRFPGQVLPECLTGINSCSLFEGSVCHAQQVNGASAVCFQKSGRVSPSPGSTKLIAGMPSRKYRLYPVKGFIPQENPVVTQEQSGDQYGFEQIDSDCHGLLFLAD
jgi:hypothetical protein